MNAIQKKRFSWIALAVILTLAVPWAAFADNTVPDGDGTTPIATNPLSLGTVCLGSTVNDTVLVAISRNGNYSKSNVFIKDTTVTVTVLSVSGAGLSANMTAPGTILIPDNWDAADNNTMSPYVTSNVIFIPVTTGSFSGSIIYRATGTGTDNKTLIRDGAVDVTATVSNCNNAPTITVNDVTMEGNTTGGWTLDFSKIGSASDAEDVSPSVSCTPAIGALLPLGATTVSCTATDSGGRTATDSGVITVVDTTPPTLVNVPSSFNVEGDTTGGASPVSYVAPTATDIVDANPSVSCLPVSGVFYPLGPTTVTCTATDATGNQAVRAFVITVVDTAAPLLINMPADVIVEGNTTGGANYGFTAPTATDVVDAVPVVSCEYVPAGAFYPLGPTTVTCTATDGAGNVASGAFIITVVDTLAPALQNMPADITLEGNAVGGVTYSFTAPTAADIVDANPSVTCDDPETGFYPLGTTTVTCTATDASGNFSSASFDVTVEDTTPPALVNMPVDVTIEGNTTGGAYYAYTDPTATDIVDPNPTVSCAPDSGFFALGTTTVTCTATDASGNSRSASFKVTVVDTTPPTIIFFSRTPTANSYGWNNSDVTVSWTCTDIVGVASPSVSSTISTEGENQSTTGTCTDTSGNTASDTQAGINIDKTAPTISAAVAPSAASTGWWNISTGAPTVSFTCGDNLSGVIACPASNTFGEGAGQSYSGTVYDKAGNSATAGVTDVDVDLTAPEIAGSAAPAANVNGWNNTDVDVTFTCSDATSGIASCGPDETLTTEGVDQYVTGEAVDNAGNSASTTVGPIGIDKTAPVVNSVVANPAAIGTVALVSADIADSLSGVASASYTIDGGSPVPMEMSGSSWTATISGLAADVYEVCVTGKDKADNVSAPVCALLAVYDPSAGFVTGGGWIMSPEGAYAANTDLTGKATFGFVSKYLKGAKIPTGNTEFQFHAASFNFKSTVYEWLVVSGSQAQYKGSGTVNGSEGYGFLLTAGDGSPDTFRLKVWEKSTGATIYDNGSNQPLGSGSIIIHTAKK